MFILGLFIMGFFWTNLELFLNFLWTLGEAIWDLCTNITRRGLFALTTTAGIGGVGGGGGGASTGQHWLARNLCGYCCLPQRRRHNSPGASQLVWWICCVAVVWHNDDGNDYQLQVYTIVCFLFMASSHHSMNFLSCPLYSLTASSWNCCPQKNPSEQKWR